MAEKTYYVSIGNSDDKLSQQEWSKFIDELDFLFADASRRVRVHGRWFSAPDTRWQNACWCVEITPELLGSIQRHLVRIAGKYGQDSLAFATATTEFLS
jgi:hypothetical protein